MAEDQYTRDHYGRWNQSASQPQGSGPAFGGSNRCDSIIDILGGMSRQDALYESCMQAKGYQKVSNLFSDN